MENPTPHEIDAMVDAGNSGGDYMQGIGKTSLDELSSDEWMMFVEAICTGFCDSMRQRAGMVMLNMNLSTNGIPEA